MSSAQYAGSVVPDTKVVWFQGTTVTRAGQALCYQETAADITKGLGTDVEVPNSSNATYFAGWVDASSAGITGPGWISIIPAADVLGQVLTIEIDGTTDVAAGDFLTLSTTSSLEGFKKDATVSGSNNLYTVCKALEAQTSDSLVAKKVYVVKA